MKKILIILLFSIQAIAQEEAKDVIYRGFYNLSFFVQSPIGQFKDATQTVFSKTNNTGLSVSYLANPRKKVGDLSTIFLGAEIGIAGNRQSDFFKPPAQGDFYMSHRQLWTNLKFRYLPILVIKKVIPYFEGSVGPKVYYSRMMENAGNDEVYKIYGFSAITLNYNLEMGAGYKITGSKRPFSYIEAGLGYGQSNSVKVIDKDRVGFTNSYEVIDTKKSVSPQNIYFKVGITSYL
jgi:hypothetical protein